MPKSLKIFLLVVLQELLSKHLRSAICQIDDKAYLMVEDYIAKGKLSMRGADKVLRLAVSIAALNGSDFVSVDHLAEA